MTRTQQRDIAAQYNVRAVADLDKEYPSVNLKRYFELQNLNVDTIIVDSPKYYATVAKALAEQPEEVLRDYAAASYISSAAPYLSDDFINADFKLSQVLSGVEEQRPRWKRALSVPNSVLGEVVGQLYVEKYFPRKLQRAHAHSRWQPPGVARRTHRQPYMDERHHKNAC